MWTPSTMWTLVRARLRTRQPVRARDQGGGDLTCWAISTTARSTVNGVGSATTTARSASCRCAVGWAARTPTTSSTGPCCELCRRPDDRLGLRPRAFGDRAGPARHSGAGRRPVRDRGRHWRGAVGRPALRRDVFEPLPGTGRWQTVLLADGNVGLGGDPLRVLRRAAELLRARRPLCRRIRRGASRVSAPAGCGSSHPGRSARGFGGRRWALTARPNSRRKPAWH